MKIKKGFVMRNVAGNNVVISVDADFVFKGMITLNETAAFMWRLLEEGASEEAILKKMLDEYEVDEATARNDIKALISRLADAGIIDMEEN